MSDDELKAELVKKAKDAGVWNAQMSWSVETLERKISEAALADPTEAPTGEIEGDEAEPEPEEPEVTELEDKPVPEGDGVLCRVSKKGDGKISDGQQGHYAWKAMVRLPVDIAGALEDRGYVEIEE